MAATGERASCRGATGIAAALAASLVMPLAAHAQTQVDANVTRHGVPLGETTTLVVTVRGARGTVSEPAFPVPPEIEVVASGRSQSFSWINGRSSNEVTYRYEIMPRAAGRFTIGPIQVKVGDQTFVSPAFSIDALQSGAGGGGGATGPSADVAPPSGAAPASLVVDVSPPDPYVGQPALMRVRLIQRAPLAEDPRYAPPPTPGFWAERASEPESYYGATPSGRVLVTETRARLYPLAAGTQTVGPAEAVIAVNSDEGFDPFGWFRSGARRSFEIKSRPTGVRVRPLPPGAPLGFAGAVGALDVRWSVDRTRTAQDQPITVRLDVRGSGNLPLQKTPEFRPEGFEVFASMLDDSLGPPGSLTPGRRAFRWTLLPRSQGTLVLTPPPYVWFDPASRAYRVASLVPITMEIGPPSGQAAAAAGPNAGYPQAFARHPLDPFGRPVRPWALAAAGLCVGAALMLARTWRARVRGVRDSEASRLAAALRAARGNEATWSEAERAADWLGARGVDVSPWRSAIAAARYGGERMRPDAVRDGILGALAHARDGGAPVAWAGAAGIGLAIAVALVILGLPQAGRGSGRTRAARAEAAARRGDVAAAEREWRRLWNEGARAAGLAARLAWSRLELDSVAPAALWVLRGEREDRGDPALAWIRQRVREAGGLAGASGGLPLQPAHAGALALAFGVVAGLPWPRRAQWGRAAAIACAVLAVALGGVAPLATWREAARGDAVVMRDVRLGGSDIDLEAGRVVQILRRATGRVVVRVGHGVDGWLPTDAVRPPESLR